MVVYAIVAVVFGLCFGYSWYIFTGWQLRDVLYDIYCSVTAGRFEALYTICGEAHNDYCYMTRSTVDRLAYLQAYDGLAPDEALFVTRRRAWRGLLKVMWLSFNLLLLMAILYLVFRPVLQFFFVGLGMTHAYYIIKIYKSSLNPHIRLTHCCIRLTEMAFQHTFGDDEAESLLHPVPTIEE